jgi:hypothetical protein
MFCSAKAAPQRRTRGRTKIAKSVIFLAKNLNFTSAGKRQLFFVALLVHPA